VEFRILGPLEVVGAVPVDVTGQRERALLVRLLLSANQVVSAERLIEDVWEDAPPDNALRALPVYISRLRKTLRGGGLDGVVVTCAPGYVLRLAPGERDADRFEALVASGRAQAAAGNVEEASIELGEALALWRGPALADFADMSFARTEAARLEEARLGALEDRIDADLACGRHTGLIGELAALVAAHPLRERLWGQRMLALYRTGRQAEALRAYQDLREILVEELGVEPTVALARLETAILRHDEELEWTPEAPRLPARTEPSAALSVPLPHFLTDVGRIFVGRDDEVARLEQLWKEAAAGERRVALLAGEPGVGKTRLAAELAVRAHNAGAVVLAGRCDEDLGVPYQPVVEALRHFADHTPSEHLAQRLGRYGGELARLVPELAQKTSELPPPLSSDPETERYRLFDAVAAWLAAVSAEAPVLIVLDDLQWAARPTLQLLRHVVHSGEGMRVLVLGAYRDSELAHDHALIEVIADLHRQGGAQRLALSGLDDTAVAAFVEQASGRSLDEDGLALVHAIYQETEGNPFFVKEVLRHLTETGAVERREGGWATRLPVEQLGIPEGVRDVVGRRLSHLSRDANGVLRVAAVMGAEFDLAVLGTAEDLDDDELVSALEEAIAARLIIEVAQAAPRYRFAHALVRDTLYQGLSAARRTRLHRRVAEAIEVVHGGRLDDQLPALAHHWARASAPAPETRKAVDYAARAGDRALAQLAHDEAAAYYRQALELLEVGEGPSGSARRVELLISLGGAQRRAGDAAFRDTLLDAARAARERGDAVALSRAALANSRSWMSSSVAAVDSGRVEVLEAALASVGEGDSPVRARLMAALGEELVYTGDRPRRVRLSEEALGMARQLGDPPTLIDVLLKRYFTITIPATLTERRRNVAELCSLAERLGDPVVTCRALMFDFRTAMEAGDVEDADRTLEQFEHLTAELGQPALTWVAGLNRVMRVMLSGDVGQAERLALANFDLGRATGQPDASLFFLAQLFCIRYEQGRLDEMERTVQEALSARPGLLPLHSLLALLYCETDRPEAARPHFEALTTDDFASVPEDNIWTLTMLYAVPACAQLNDAPRAAVLHRLLRPYADQFGFDTGGTRGSFAHHLGLLATVTGQFDEADAQFAAAGEVHERMGAPTWLARTRLEWARMLLARRRPGDADQAKRLLRQARATAKERGLGNVERRAVELMASR
jgi:DNA-binding SARP family transcriptional activator